jgi:hypothetical protein
MLFYLQIAIAAYNNCYQFWLFDVAFIYLLFIYLSFLLRFVTSSPDGPFHAAQPLTPLCYADEIVTPTRSRQGHGVLLFSASAKAPLRRKTVAIG